MSYRSGTAFIDVTPSFKGFNAKSEAFVKTLKPIKIPTVFDDPKGQVPAPKKPVRVPVELDDGKFQRDIKSKLEAAIKSLPKAEIGASTSEAPQKLKDLRAELVALSGKRIGVDVSEGEALAKIRELQAEAERLGASSPTIQARVDAGAAAAELAGLTAMVDNLGRKSPAVKVDADTTSAQAQIAALSGGSVLVKVALAASPLAGPVGAGLLGGLGGLSAIGAGVGAGVLGAAAIGGLAIKQATDAQDKLEQATTKTASAAGAAKSAQQSLASAVTAAANAEIAAARAVESAQQSLADARRNQARAAEQAAQQVADARQRVADAERNQARAAEQAAKQVASAQQQEVAAQKRVEDSLGNLHQARAQAVRDLEDMRNQTAASGNSVTDAQIAIQEAQQRLAELQTSGTTNVVDYARAKQDLTEAQQRLKEAELQHGRDVQDLATGEQQGVDGNPRVKAAQDQVDAALLQQAQAREGVAEAQKAAEQAREDGARAVRRAKKDLADARQAAREAREDAARGVAKAETALAQARADGARTQAQAQAQVADASAKAATAQQSLNEATAAQQAILASITPAQQKALAAIASLKSAWGGFLLDIDEPLGGAIVSGAGMLEKALGPLAVFIRPVARSLATIFDLLGGAAASKGAKNAARVFGVFSGSILADAATGSMNLATGFGFLFEAFMPLGSDMSDGLVRLTARFARWSSTVKDSDGFKSFIGYVRENGPLLLSVLGETGKLLVNVAIALAPVGEWLLKTTLSVVKWVSEFAKAHPTITAVVGGVIAFVAAGSAIVGIIAPVVAAGAAIGGMGMLAIAAIIAIDTGLVLLWKKSETFRDIVTGVWGVVSTAISGAWTYVIKPTLVGIKDFLTDVMFPTLNFLWSDVVKPVFGAIKDIVRNTWSDVLRPIFGAWKSFFDDVLGPAIGFLWNKVVAPAFEGIGAIISDAWRDVIHPVFGKLGDGVGALKGIFQAALDGIGEVWSGIKGIFADPVNWVIDNVLNKLISGVNAVASKLGKDNFIDLIPNIKTPGSGNGNKGGKSGTGVNAAEHGMASGGVLPGYTPGRDVHHFFSPTAGGLHLSGGEAVMVPEWTRAVGGSLAVARMNKAARAGGKAFAVGGVFRPVAGGSPGSIHGASTGFPAVDVAIPVGSPVASVAAGRVSKSYDILGYEPRRPGAQDGYRSYGRVIQVLHDGFSSLYAHLSKRGVSVGDQVGGGQLLGLSGNTGNSTGPHLHFGVQGRSPMSFFGGSTAFTGSVDAGVGANTAGGIDLAGSLGFLKDLGGGKAPGGAFGSLIAKGAADTLGGLAKSWITDKVKDAALAPLRGIEDLAQGAASLFDSGGYLPPGLSMVYNGTRRPEPVFTRQQAAALATIAERGGLDGPVQISGQLDIRDGQAYIEGIATSVMNGVGAQAGRRGAWATG